MIDARLLARGELWEWVAESDERAYADGLVDACEQAGLLDPGEIAHWRALIERGGAADPGPGDSGAAERHLETLLAQLPGNAERRFDGALEALWAAGMLSDEAELRWRERAVLAGASSLADDHPRGDARRVFVPDRIVRRDGLAVVAVVARTETTEVLFHGDHEAFGVPALTDDRGTSYAPLPFDPPAGAIGAWRYLPAAPDAATAFEAAAGSARWIV